MKIYYKDGFYLDNPPEGAVQITEETYRTLFQGQAQGKQIVADEQGYPMLIELQPSPYHTLQGTEWVIDKAKQAELLASQQAQVWEQIKQKRYKNYRSGVYVKSVDKWFHSDDGSRQQYTFMRTLPDFPPTRWKTMDNSFVELTKDLLNELSLAMFAHEQADFANAERHRAAMLAAKNPLDYDYSTGWQEVYNG